MIKALFKKQLWETLAFFTMGKEGKRRKPMAVAGFALLMAYCAFAGGFMFWGIAESFCEAFALNGYAWLYFALMGTMATGMGIIVGLFIAKAKLYEAKDNELLLSMPIPPKYILLSRALSLYAFILLFQALVFVPTLLVYFITVGFSAWTLILGVLSLIVLTLGTTALCCLLGCLIAWLTSRLPMKNLVTIILTVGFLIGYFILVNKITEGLAYLVANGDKVSKVMETALFPFSAFGKGVAGKPLFFLAFLGIFGALFALVSLVISATYLRIVTRNRGEKKAKYKGAVGVKRSAKFALLKKELLRFIKSPVYILNASMGTILAVIFAVFSLFDGMGGLFGADAFSGDTLFLITAIFVCVFTGMNTITACSVSLEGDSLWVVRSLPVSAWDVLKAKLSLHLIVSGLPLLLVGTLLGVGAGLGVWQVLLILLASVTYTVFFGAFGLAMNLKFPNLKWTNETVAVKQGIATMIAMFGGWGIIIVPVLVHLAIGAYFTAWAYVLLWTGVMACISVALFVWLKKRGANIFEGL